MGHQKVGESIINVLAVNVSCETGHDVILNTNIFEDKQDHRDEPWQEVLQSQSLMEQLHWDQIGNNLVVLVVQLSSLQLKVDALQRDLKYIYLYNNCIMNYK